MWLASSEKLPTFEFLGRGNRVSDLVGEKLNETFVGKVLDSVLTEESRYRMLVPTQIERRRYILLLDQTDSSPFEIGAAVEAELAKAYHYNHARILGQLDPVEVIVDASAAEKMGEFYQRNGLKLGISSRVIWQSGWQMLRFWSRLEVPPQAEKTAGRPVAHSLARV